MTGEAPFGPSVFVYEVEVTVNRDIRDRYLKWLKDHVNDVLATRCFLGCQIYEVNTIEKDAIFVIHYFAPERMSIDRYFQEHAPKLRSLTEEKFGGKYTAKRRVLSHILTSHGT